MTAAITGYTPPRDSLKKNIIKILTDNNFGLVILLVLALIFVYQDWPWSSWQADSGVGLPFLEFPYLHDLAVIEMQNRIIGLLFYIPLIYAAFALSWKQALIVSSLSLAGMLPIILDVWYMGSAITNMVYLLLPALFASITSIKLESHRRERRILAEREAERQIFVSKVLESQENERRRISQELHDETIQTLLVLANHANDLASNCYDNEDEIRTKATWMRDSTLHTIDDLRRICLDLRPIILDTLGLVPALKTLVKGAETQSNRISTNLVVIGQERKLSPQIEITLFRIVQEALNNIRQHSQASVASVTLEYSDDEIKLTIKDNGHGFIEPRRFDELALSGRLGLLGMKQRIDLLGGQFRILSSASAGTLLSIHLKD